MAVERSIVFDPDPIHTMYLQTLCPDTSNLLGAIRYNMAKISDPNPQFWMRYLQVFNGLAAQVRLVIDQSGQDTKAHKNLICDWVTNVIPESIEASSNLDFFGNTEAVELFDALFEIDLGMESEYEATIMEIPSRISELASHT